VVRRALAVAAVLWAGTGITVPAFSQSLEELVRQGKAGSDSTRSAPTAGDSVKVEPAPWGVLVGETLAGSALAAALGFGIGALAEATFCDGCDAGEPGGDTPGLIVGVPIGALAGVWLVGRHEPPPGRIQDTFLAALAGAGVFAGFSALLENQSDGVRWSGVLLSGGIAAIGWNRSRLPEEPEPEPQELPKRRRPRGASAQLELIRITF
jgi:hypothetical protein